MAAIPVVDVAEEDVVFGLNFAGCDADLEHANTKLIKFKKRFARLHAASTSFANSFVQWEYSKETDFLLVVNDGVNYNPNGADRFYAGYDLEIEVVIVHVTASGTPVFVLSVNSTFTKPGHSISYPVGDLHLTVANYGLKVTSKAFFQLAILPGSACAIDGSCITFREK